MSNNGNNTINLDAFNFLNDLPIIIHFTNVTKVNMAKLIHINDESESKVTKETSMINKDDGYIPNSSFLITLYRSELV